MSEVIEFETVIALPAAVAVGVAGLAVAAVAGGVMLGTAVTRLVARETAATIRGVREGFTDQMEKAVQKLTAPAEGGADETPVDGLRCLRTLRQACEQIAIDRGGNLVETIVDARGRKQEILVGIVYDRAPSGLGVRIDDQGNLLVVADPSVVPRDVIDEFRKDLETNYTALGVAEALRTLNYNFGVTRPGAGQIVISGERSG